MSWPPSTDQAASTADIQAILDTLAQVTPRASSGESLGSPAPATETTPQVQPPELRDQPQKLLPRPQERSAAASPKPIDPATITTWQEGLRCVTKIAAQNARFAETIKRMIRDQRDRELRWYSERQNLKTTQRNRNASAAKAQSILQSLSGINSDRSSTKTDPEAELAAFDNKIYSAQVDMEHAMTAELRTLGVPFFGTESRLIIAEGESVDTRFREEQPRWSPAVTEQELMALRRKMVAHLEDLYRD